MRTAATYSIKGGVGKTTAAVNLAFEAARSGSRVLLWDLDPQGAATFFFRVKAKVRGGAAGLVGRRSTDTSGPATSPACTSCRPTFPCGTSTCTSTPPNDRPSGSAHCSNRSPTATT